MLTNDSLSGRGKCNFLLSDLDDDLFDDSCDGALVMSGLKKYRSSVHKGAQRDACIYKSRHLDNSDTVSNLGRLLLDVYVHTIF